MEAVSTELIRRNLSNIYRDEISELNLQPMAGDASSRFFLRVRFNLKGQLTSNVVMVYPPELKETIPDFIYLSQYLRKRGIGAPKVFYADAERGFIICEDLGDVLMEEALKHIEQRKLYSKALELLLKIQKKCNDDPGCIAFKRKFDADWFMYELNFFYQHTLVGHHKARLTAREEEAFKNDCQKLAMALDVPIKVFCHRDFHCRNILIKNGLLRLVDFQDARLGTPLYDLASLLRDSYFELPQKLFGELLYLYFSECKGKMGLPQDFEKFQKLFYLMALQRNIKAAGSFGFLSNVKKKMYFLEYLPRTYGYIRQNLKKHSSFPALFDIFSRYIPDFNQGIDFDLTKE